MDTETNLDLDLDNYDLEDLLSLFKIPYNFGKDELKSAKTHSFANAS